MIDHNEHKTQKTDQPHEAPAKLSSHLGALFGGTDDRSVAIGARIYTRFEMVFVAAILAVVAGMLLASPAFAQNLDSCGSGDGNNILTTLENAFAWLAYLIVLLAAIGFVISAGIKAIARTNENMHQAAHMGMGGALIAAAAGILTPDAIDLIKSWTGC